MCTRNERKGGEGDKVGASFRYQRLCLRIYRRSCRDDSLWLPGGNLQIPAVHFVLAIIFSLFFFFLLVFFDGVMKGGKKSG